MRWAADARGDGALQNKGFLRAGVALIALMACGRAALAQRADENAYTSAEDAFGTRVGLEGVGLYDPHNARGFDPTLAGNIRLEGLYFDQQGAFGQRLNRSQSMHVGISAQSYPLPAPTGIADLAIVLPGDKRVVSVSVTHQDRGGANQNSLDISTPLTDSLGMVIGGVYTPSTNEYGGHNHNAAGAALLRWRPNDALEVIPFFNYNALLDIWVQPQLFSAGNFLPPAYHRGDFYGQTWASRDGADITYGVIARGTPFANWRLQAGLFRADSRRPDNFSVFYRNVQTDGTASLDVLGFPTSKSASTSGEVRATGVYTTGDYRQTIHLALRGRDTERLFNGASTISFGPATIGVYKPVPAPVFVFGPRDKDVVHQLTPGVSYVGQWARVGEFSVGVQKSFYHRDFGREGTTPVSTKSQPWLYNGTLSVTPIASLAFYAGYTRGLEEFGTAPDIAVNRGQPVPADITRQIDAGLRYRIVPGLSLMAGVFQVKKPYFDRDPANIYTRVGDRSHKGVEMSLAGQLAPSLTIVAGAVFIKARITGSSVDRGLIGAVPLGLPPAVYTLSLNYGPPSWHGFAVDTVIKDTAASYANRTDTFKVPNAATVDLGARYNFVVRAISFNIRAQVFNVSNAYDWKADPVSSSLFPTPPRRYAMRLAADF